jgi:hypothetical protein
MEHNQMDLPTISSGLLPDSHVAQRYKVDPRTLDRWDRRPELNFPKPIRINHRKYRYLHELETWERQRVSVTA